MGQPEITQSKLTDREKDVGALLAQGYSAHGIAEILKLHILTVRKHLSIIYAKLGVNKNKQWNPRSRAAYLLRNLERRKVQEAK